MWLGMAGDGQRASTQVSHDNFCSVYWIFTKLGHMIPLWKGKNPICFGVITIIPFDNLYRRAYFVMHTFLVLVYICLFSQKTKDYATKEYNHWYVNHGKVLKKFPWWPSWKKKLEFETAITLELLVRFLQMRA